MTRIYAYIFAVFFFFPSSVFAVGFMGRVNILDLINGGTHIFTTTCDSGATKFDRFDVNGGRRLTITVNGKILYYIFSPNPNSISPITWTFAAGADNLMPIPINERNEQFKKNTPNLYAYFGRKENDCTRELLVDKDYFAPKKK